MALFWFDAKAGIAFFQFYTLTLKTFLQKNTNKLDVQSAKKEVSGNFIKRKFKKENSDNFIKIAYSGNSEDTPPPPPNQIGFATPLRVCGICLFVCLLVCLFACFVCLFVVCLCVCEIPTTFLYYAL